MPTNFTKEQLQRAGQYYRDRQPEPEAPPTGFGEQLGGALYREHAVLNAFRRLSEGFPQASADYDPLQHLLPGEEIVADRYATVRSAEEHEQVRERWRREERARRAVETGPLNEFLITALAVGVDPVSYLPIVGLLLKGVRGARLATRLGVLSAGTAAEVGVAEGILQASQESRTAAESWTAVLLGGAFGFGAGGVATAAARAEARQLDRAVKDFLTIAEAEMPGSTNRPAMTEVQRHIARAGAPDSKTPLPEATPPPEGGSSAGAAQVAKIDLTSEETKLVKSGLNKLLRLPHKYGFTAPSVELLGSEFATARELALRLVDTGLVVAGNLVGRASPVSVHTRIKRYEGVLGPAHQYLHREWRSHRDAGGGMAKLQFFEEVSRAMRRNDVHVDPAVQRTAQWLRANLFDPLKKEAFDVGAFGEIARDAKTAADIKVEEALSYLTRVYNREKIVRRRTTADGNGFQDIVWKYLARKFPKEGPAEIQDMAKQIVDTILGNPAGRVHFVRLPSARGPLKERTFHIPDELIEDYLENNISEIITRYVRTMGADIEFTREFGRADAFDVENGAELSRLQDEVNQASRAVDRDPKFDTPEAKAREKKRIEEEGKRLVKVVQGLADRTRGTYGAPLDGAYLPLRRIARAVRTFNFVRLLGSVTISSIADVGNIVLKEGLARSAGQLFAQFGTGFKAVKMGKAEGNLAGTAWDVTMSTRLNAIADLGERYASETKLEKGLDTAGRWYGMITLLDPWNTAMKSMTAVMVSTRILKTVDKLASGKALTKREARKLALSTISPEMAERIAKQKQHWEKNGASLIANTAEWTDQEAVDAFRNALLRDVDNTIITPTPGDAPLWTGTEWGKTLFQFKRFGAAATQRILLSGLQERDMVTLNGLMFMVGMGALGTALRDYASGGELRERTTAEWVRDAVDRSGALGMYFEMESLSDKAFGISPTGAFTGKEASRFASRDFFGQLLGPTAGLASEILQVISGIKDGTVTQSDARRIQKLIPGQNHFLTRYWVDQLGKTIAEGLGLPERAPRTRSRKPLAAGQ